MEVQRVVRDVREGTAVTVVCKWPLAKIEPPETAATLPYEMTIHNTREIYAIDYSYFVGSTPMFQPPEKPLPAGISVNTNTTFNQAYHLQSGGDAGIYYLFAGEGIRSLIYAGNDREALVAALKYTDQDMGSMVYKIAESGETGFGGMRFTGGTRH